MALNQIIKQAPEPFNLDSSGDQDYFVIKGYATTYGNVDKVGDVIARGAFSESFNNKENREPVILWQHNHQNPIGMGQLQDDEKGIFLTARMPKNDDFVKNRVMPQVSIGSVKSFSIGFSFNPQDLEFKNGTTVISKAAINETSLVTFPANPQAEITSFKSFMHKDVGAARNLSLADSDVSWDSDKAVKRVREFTKSEDAPSSSYKRAFLYYDGANADNFTAYRLPFADVVEGELKAIPRALSAAVGAINGARGGLSSVPENELPRIKSIINSYYKKMGKDDPFAQKCFDIDYVKKFCSKRDLEMCLRESGMFSRAAAMHLCKYFEFNQSEPDENQKTIQEQWDEEILKLNQLLGKA